MRNVKFAKLHTDLHVPGIGDLGRTLNTANTQYKFRAIKMTWDGAGLEVSSDGRTVYVPGTNVAYMEFGPAPIETRSQAV